MDRSEYLDRLHGRYAVTPADLSRLVRQATGTTMAASKRLIRGDENEVHRVELTDGAVVYVRVAFPDTPPSKLRHEAWAMGQARDGGVPVPEVLATGTVDSPDGERVTMVLREADGRQLSEVLPSLDSQTRAAALAEVGRVLSTLHAIPMPGAGVPDEHDEWAEPVAHRNGYVEGCLAATERLPAAGLTPAEVGQVVDLLERSADFPVGDPVLCHGDVSPEHVFVDADLRVVGLIDWGLWHADSAASELAGLDRTSAKADLDAILAGYDGLRTDEASRQIAWFAIVQLIGEMGWLMRSGQTAELPSLVATMRRQLATIASRRSR
jgi:aminoglycoside phosphotransferase (APT) family kinase protein